MDGGVGAKHRGPVLRTVVGVTLLMLFAEPILIATITVAEEAALVVILLPALCFAMLRPLVRLQEEELRSAKTIFLRTRELSARNAIIAAAADSRDPDAFFSGVVDVILSVFDADGGWFLLHREGRSARVVGARGDLPSSIYDGLVAARNCELACKFWRAGGQSPLIDECSYVSKDSLRDSGFEGYAGVVLQTRPHLCAVLNLVWRVPKKLEDADRGLLEALMQNVTIAADRADLLETEARETAAAEAMKAASIAFSRSLDVDMVRQVMFDHLRRFVPYESVDLRLFHNGSLPSDSSFTRVSEPGRQSASEELDDPNLTLENRWGASRGDRRHMDLAPPVERRRGPQAGWSRLCVPLLSDGRWIGVVILDKRDEFDSSEVRAAEALCAAASVAIVNAELFGQVRDGRERLETVSRRLVTLQETESRHIAHELHDEIGQSLTAVLYRLQACGTADVERKSDLDEAIEITKRTMKSVRNMSLNLHPPLLDEAGLVATLRWYIDRQVRTDSLDVDLLASQDLEDLPDDVRNVCFRIVQEALTNVVRHARARRVRVELGMSGSSVEILVRDDGRGFDVDEAYLRARNGASLGLLGMEEKVDAFGGQLIFESKPGTGTNVWAIVPFSQVC